MTSESSKQKLTIFEIEQAKERSTKRIVILTIRLLFITFMFAAAILPFIAGLNAANRPIDEIIVDHLGPLISTIAFAAIVLIIDIITPNKRLSAVLGVYLGLVVGLFAALAVSLLIDLIGDSWGLNKGDIAFQYLTLLKLVSGITLCYFGISEDIAKHCRHIWREHAGPFSKPVQCDRYPVDLSCPCGPFRKCVRRHNCLCSGLPRFWGELLFQPRKRLC